MELELKPVRKNGYSVCGFFIKGVSPKGWLTELNRLNVPLNTIHIHALPDTRANSVWGCYVEFNSHQIPKDIGINEYATCLFERLVVPQGSEVFPQVLPGELEALFKGQPAVMHPHFGCFELDEPLDLTSLVALPDAKSPRITIPEDPVFIPRQIKSFQVASLSPEEALEKMSKDHFPEKEQHREKPLNSFEKLRLKIYRGLFSSNETGQQKGEDSKGGLFDGAGKVVNEVGRWLDRFLPIDKAVEKMQQDFENLEERNKKEVDKLLNMLKDDPLEALKYAIPLSEYDTSRGSQEGGYQFGQRWSDWSLGQTSSSAGGRTVNLGDHYFMLRKQYLDTAQQLIKKGEYQKAAFVYIKLLQDYHTAAKVLEDGKLYAEAASVYLQHIENKEKAAECYVKAQMIDKAIELYEELDEWEKAGDLHMEINQKKEAFVLYRKSAKNHLDKLSYVKAAKVYKEKMDDRATCQDYLLEGWRKNFNAQQCLDFYFSNIEDEKVLKQSVEQVYEKEVDEGNRVLFLNVLVRKYKMAGGASATMKDIGYQIVSQEVEKKPHLISELIAFNTDDKEFKKDTLRYKLRHK